METAVVPEVSSARRVAVFRGYGEVEEEDGTSSDTDENMPALTRGHHGRAQEYVSSFTNIDRCGGNIQTAAKLSSCQPIAAAEVD